MNHAAPVARVACRSDGSVTVDAEREARVELIPGPVGWRVVGLDATEGRAERVVEDGGGFRLRRASSADDEGARTVRFPDGLTGREAQGRHVLLEDGRLFRLVERGGTDPRFELLSWEVPGPYLVARPADDGWTIEPEASGGALADLRALWVLMALEILDAETNGMMGRTTDDAP